MTDHLSTARSRTPLKLIAVSGPTMQPVNVQPERAVVLGRSHDCDVQMVEATVSRRHVIVRGAGDRWLLTDLGSSYGTFVNTVRLNPNEPVELADGDLVRIGPWLLRAKIGSRSDSTIASTMVDERDRDRVRTIDEREIVRLAQHRLELLLQYAGTINASADEESLADSVLTAALAGTGFEHAALVRLTGTEDEIEVLGRRSREPEDEWEGSISQSLVREAARGKLVTLSPDSVSTAQSIVKLDIHEAICAPVHIGSSVAALLYLDSRGGGERSGESRVEADAAGFCQAVARICGLALGNLKRIDLQKRQGRIENELAAARQAQTLMMPRTSGSIGHVHYQLSTRPGHFVAGDLFDILDLPDEQAAFFLGDVSGKGIGAAVIMAAAQSQLHSSLLRFCDPERAMTELNRYLAGRLPPGNFLTLWTGVLDPKTGVLRFVDAGHGHWLIKRKGASAAQVDYRGGILLGLQPEYQYHAEEIPIEPGDRIYLYSDGVTEQVSPQGEQFGRERLLQLIDSIRDGEDDAATIMAKIEAFAGTESLADDTTIASIHIPPAD